MKKKMLFDHDEVIHATVYRERTDIRDTTFNYGLRGREVRLLTMNPGVAGSVCASKHLILMK